MTRIVWLLIGALIGLVPLVEAQTTYTMELITANAAQDSRVIRLARSRCRALELQADPVGSIVAPFAFNDVDCSSTPTVANCYCTGTLTPSSDQAHRDGLEAFMLEALQLTLANSDQGLRDADGREIGQRFPTMSGPDRSAMKAECLAATSNPCQFVGE